MASIPPALCEKRKKALRCLEGTGRILVALSGGVDSALLLALAVKARGRGRVLAVTGRSPSLPPEDLADASAVARSLGVKHRVVDTGEVSLPAYRANLGDRCYHCRSVLFSALEELGRGEGAEVVAYGAIADDAGDHRPGMRAAGERGVLAPLLEAGIGKEEVRLLAREAGLPVSEKPAAACLSSRIPVGTEVTEERLRQVGRAESALRALGLRQLRVRHHGEVARLELDGEGGRRLEDPDFRRAVVAAVRAAGFRFVTVDLEGYRTGSLNPPAT